MDLGESGRKHLWSSLRINQGCLRSARATSGTLVQMSLRCRKTLTDKDKGNLSARRRSWRCPNRRARSSTKLPPSKIDDQHDSLCADNFLKRLSPAFCRSHPLTPCVDRSCPPRCCCCCCPNMLLNMPSNCAATVCVRSSTVSRRTDSEMVGDRCDVESMLGIR